MKIAAIVETEPLTVKIRATDTLVTVEETIIHRKYLFIGREVLIEIINQRAYILGLLGGRDEFDVVDGSITGELIAEQTVETRHLDSFAVETRTIAFEAVTGSRIAPGTITLDKMSVGSVGQPQLRTQSVTEDKILTRAVSSRTIDNEAVQTAHVKPGAITSRLIADYALTRANTTVEASFVTTAMLAPESVTPAKIKKQSIITDLIAPDTITSPLITRGAVTRDKIADFAIDSSKIREVDASRVQSGEMLGARIAKGSLLPDRISSGEFGRTLVLTPDARIETIEFSDTAGWRLSGNGLVQINDGSFRGAVRESVISNSLVGAGSRIQLGTKFIVSDTGEAFAEDATLAGRLRMIAPQVDRAFLEFKIKDEQRVHAFFEFKDSFRSLFMSSTASAIKLSNDTGDPRTESRNSVDTEYVPHYAESFIYTIIGTVGVSDRRTKRDIRSYAGGLDTVESTPVRVFKRKADPKDRDFVGWIAQEAPDEAVVDINGTLHINESQMLAILWDAVRELSAQWRSTQTVSSRTSPTASLS